MPSPILKYFAFAHLPPNLQEVSKPIGELAQAMDEKLPDGAEKSAGLRKLLEAKDCLVRALLPLVLLAVVLAAAPASAEEKFGGYTYDELGCYQPGPNVVRAENRDDAGDYRRWKLLQDSLKAFKVGDTVAMDYRGGDSRVAAADGHVFEILEVLPKYKQGYDFYRSRDLKTGEIWKLSPFEMVRVDRPLPAKKKKLKVKTIAVQIVSVAEPKPVVAAPAPRITRTQEEYDAFIRPLVEQAKADEARTATVKQSLTVRSACSGGQCGGARGGWLRRVFNR